YADQQAALRRVATLVARGAWPEEVFTAVTEEVGRLLEAELVSMDRYDPDGTVTVLAARPATLAAGWSIGGRNVSRWCSRRAGRPGSMTTRRPPARAPSPPGSGGFRSAVGAPPKAAELRAQLDGIATGLTGVLDELREFARGIHPAILADGGLGPALRTL